MQNHGMVNNMTETDILIRGAFVKCTTWCKPQLQWKFCAKEDNEKKSTDSCLILRKKLARAKMHTCFHWCTHVVADSIIARTATDIHRTDGC